MIRTLIYGSCVSRDTFEFLKPHGYELKGYIARQSLLSAFSPMKREALPPMEVRSAFQRRMLEGDWTGSLVTTMEKEADAIDVVLWDLCDERLGVRSLRQSPPWQFATRSVDSIRAGLDGQLSGHALWRPDERRFRKLFDERLNDMGDLLDRTGLRQKTILLAPAWATQTNSGGTTPDSFGWNPRVANRVFARYHERIRSRLDLMTVERAPSEVEASENHRWGPAPFHYSDAVYESMTRDIRSLI